MVVSKVIRFPPEGSGNRKKGFCMMKAKMKQILFIGIFIVSVSSLWAQNWIKEVSKDRWGDVKGYTYSQTTTGVAHGDTDVSIHIGFFYSTQAEVRNVLGIGSRTIDDLKFHPAAGFLNEAVTLSLRSNGITTTYKGSTISSEGNFDRVVIVIMDSELIKKLKSSGQWDVLIEGKNWYIRTKINGNLPNE